MMEQLKLSPEIIELGRALVAHLAKDDQGRDDLLSKWMAHDIAAKIKAAEAEPSNAQAQADCTRAILQLWDHRAVYPHPKRPTEEYESILRTLERLDPTEARSFYLSDAFDVPDKGEKWLTAAVTLDRSARILISYILKEAAARAKSDTDWSTLARKAGLGEDAGLSVLRVISFGPDNPKLDSKELERKRLSGLLSELRLFQKTSRLIAAALKSELEALELLSNLIKLMTEFVRYNSKKRVRLNPESAWQSREWFPLRVF